MGPQYVIVREDGQFVTPPGREKSYSPNLTDARRFWSMSEAQAECCVDNETVRTLNEVFLDKWGAER